MRTALMWTALVCAGCEQMGDVPTPPLPDPSSVAICDDFIPLCLSTEWVYFAWSGCDPATWVDTVTVIRIEQVNGDTVWTLDHSIGFQELLTRTENTVYRVSIDSAIGLLARTELFWIPSDSMEVHGQTQARFLRDTIQTPLGPVYERIVFETSLFFPDPPQDTPVNGGLLTYERFTVRPGVGIISREHRSEYLSCNNCGRIQSCSSREELIAFTPGPTK